MSKKRIEQKRVQIPLVKADLEKPDFSDIDAAESIPKVITLQTGIFGPLSTDRKITLPFMEGRPFEPGRFKIYSIKTISQMIRDQILIMIRRGEIQELIKKNSEGKFNLKLKFRDLAGTDFEVKFGREGYAYQQPDAEGFVNPPHVALTGDKADKSGRCLFACDVTFDCEVTFNDIENNPEDFIVHKIEVAEINNKSQDFTPKSWGMQWLIAILMANKVPFANTVILHKEFTDTVTDEVKREKFPIGRYTTTPEVLREIVKPLLDEYSKEFIANNQVNEVRVFNSCVEKSARSRIQNQAMKPQETPIKSGKRVARHNSDHSPIKTKLEFDANTSPADSPTRSRQVRASFPGPAFKVPSFNLDAMEIDHNESDFVKPASINKQKSLAKSDLFEKKLGKAPATFDAAPMTIKKPLARSQYRNHLEALQGPPLFNLNMDDKAFDDEESPKRFSQKAFSSDSNFFENKLAKAPATFDPCATPSNSPVKKSVTRNHTQALQGPLPFRLNLDDEAFDEDEQQEYEGNRPFDY